MTGLGHRSTAAHENRNPGIRFRSNERKKGPKVAKYLAHGAWWKLGSMLKDTVPLVKLRKITGVATQLRQRHNPNYVDSRGAWSRFFTITLRSRFFISQQFLAFSLIFREIDH